MSERPRQNSAKVDVMEVSERLFRTSTKSREGFHPEEETRATKVVSTEEMKQIISRLRKQTKANGDPCRTPEPKTLPGYGLKMFPAIDGLDTRFIGQRVNKKKMTEVTERLSSATTRASRARLENHRILLYPERTLLFNDTERITQFQESGVVVKQKDMSTREKWYN